VGLRGAQWGTEWDTGQRCGWTACCVLCNVDAAAYVNVDVDVLANGMTNKLQLPQVQGKCRGRERERVNKESHFWMINFT